jgi:hypothetical protein
MLDSARPNTMQAVRRSREFLERDVGGDHRELPAWCCSGQTGWVADTPSDLPDGAGMRQQDVVRPRHV